jgi:hypothetical protein
MTKENESYFGIDEVVSEFLKAAKYTGKAEIIKIGKCATVTINSDARISFEIKTVNADFESEESGEERIIYVPHYTLNLSDEVKRWLDMPLISEICEAVVFNTMTPDKTEHFMKPFNGEMYLSTIKELPENQRKKFGLNSLGANIPTPPELHGMVSSKTINLSTTIFYHHIRGSLYKLDEPIGG